MKLAQPVMLKLQPCSNLQITLKVKVLHRRSGMPDVTFKSSTGCINTMKGCYKIRQCKVYTYLTNI